MACREGGALAFGGCGLGSQADKAAMAMMTNARVMLRCFTVLS